MAETHDNRTETHACDLISRQAAFDALNGIKIAKGANWYEFYQKALTAVGNLPSAQSGWIPCSDRLPEDGRVVLWCNEHGSVFTTAITARFDNSWAVGKRHRSSRMVAWMPLPEPWKGEKHGTPRGV